MIAVNPKNDWYQYRLTFDSVAYLYASIIGMTLRTETDLKAFYDAHYRPAVRQAFRIVNDLAEAEDIAQECIVRLWDKRGEIGTDRPLAPYFHRMVRNRSIDMLRRRIPRDDGADIGDLEFTPADGMEFAEISRAVDALIDGLPEKCRRVFVLSRFEAMSYKEISSQLDISVKTVENQISKALKVLREGLGDPIFSIFF